MTRPPIPDYVDMDWEYAKSPDLEICLDGEPLPYAIFKAVKKGEYALRGWTNAGEDEKVLGNYEVRWK